jgi:hypothetical protein
LLGYEKRFPIGARDQSYKLWGKSQILLGVSCYAPKIALFRSACFQRGEQKSSLPRFSNRPLYLSDVCFPDKKQSCRDEAREGNGIDVVSPSGNRLPHSRLHFVSEVVSEPRIVVDEEDKDQRWIGTDPKGSTWGICVKRDCTTN